MRVLVAGGAGFMGSHYVRTMLSGGYPDFEQAAVTVLDTLGRYGNLGTLAPVAGHPSLTFVRGDICDAELMARLVPGHEYVVNFAVATTIDKSIKTARALTAANVTRVQVLSQACLQAGVRRLRHVSTKLKIGRAHV